MSVGDNGARVKGGDEGKRVGWSVSKVGFALGLSVGKELGSWVCKDGAVLGESEGAAVVGSTVGNGVVGSKVGNGVTGAAVVGVWEGHGVEGTGVGAGVVGMAVEGS